MYIFILQNNPKCTLLLLCSVPFEFPRRVDFKANIPKWMWLSSMECLHCAWSISSLVVILHYRVIYLSYPASPLSFQEKSVTLSLGRGCVIFGESKLVYLSLFLNLSLWYFAVDQTKRKFLGFKKGMFWLLWVLCWLHTSATCSMLINVTD